MTLTLFSFKDACECVSHNNTQTIAGVTYFRLLRIKCQEISCWHLKVS